MLDAYDARKHDVYWTLQLEFLPAAHMLNSWSREQAGCLLSLDWTGGLTQTAVKMPFFSVGQKLIQPITCSFSLFTQLQASFSSRWGQRSHAYLMSFNNIRIFCFSKGWSLISGQNSWPNLSTKAHGIGTWPLISTDSRKRPEPVWTAAG